MIKAITVEDVMGGTMLLVFGLGFLNIFGAQYTWWALMKYLAG